MCIHTYILCFGLCLFSLISRKKPNIAQACAFLAFLILLSSSHDSLSALIPNHQRQSLSQNVSHLLSFIELVSAERIV